MAGVNIDSDLSNERICESELGQSIDGDSELANADKADAELENSNNPTGKRTNRNKPPGRHGDAIRPVFEGDVQQREPQDGGLGLVFEAPSVPFLLCGERGPTIGTSRGLLRNLVLAFSTRLHVIAAARLLNVIRAYGLPGRIGTQAVR